MSGITTTVSNGVLTSTAWVSGPTTLVIPASVTSISSTAFTGSTSVKTRITSVTFNTNVNLKAIPASLFNGCTALATVSFPSNTSITSIGASAFSGCTALNNITLPSTVTSIGDGAFAGCNKLPSINIPSGVTSIGTAAFNACTSLTSIIIPKEIKIIPQQVFLNCTSLTSITLQRTISQDLNLTILAADCFLNTGISLTNYLSVTNMYKMGYTRDDLIKSAGISSTIVDASINNFLDTFFIYNANKTTIIGYNLSVSVTNIAVIIPTTVTSIAASAFLNCTDLTRLQFLGTTSPLTFLDTNCFSNTGISLTNNLSITDMYNIGYSIAQLNTAGIKSSVTDQVSQNFNFIILNAGKTSVTGCNNNASSTSGSINVYLPNTVTSVGVSAFQNSTKIKTITFSSFFSSIGNSAFSGCTYLVNLSLPNYMGSIGTSAFSGCTKLNSVNIPLYVTNISTTAFSGTTALTDIVFVNNIIANITLGSNCFSNTGITTTNYMAAVNMINMGFSVTQLNTAGIVAAVTTKASTNLSYLTLNATKTTVTTYNSAIYIAGMTIYIPNTVTNIGPNAFLNSTILEKINIPSSVTNISSSAFQGCTALTSVTLQRTSAQDLTTLGTNCFSTTGFTTTNYLSVTNMYNMGYTTSQLTTSGISTDILNKAIVDAFFVFDNPTNKTSLVGFNSAVNVTGITLEIPTSVTSIGPNAFLNCDTITSVTISSSVTSIGSSAFQGCTALTAATIPASVKTIGNYAFQGCGFRNYTWPNTLPTINDYMFDDCIFLQTVKIIPTVPKTKFTLGKYVFKGCKSLK